jgi:DHA2 family multidrug resistance protein-like MFS transporter
MCLATLLVASDAFVLLQALPHIGAGLAADGIEQLWMADIYGIMLGGFLMTMGGLGDRIGRRKLLLIGAGAFGLASLAAAFSTTPEMLIVARGLLGVAGATLAPSTLGLIRNMFRDPRQMGVAIGVWASFFTIGAVAGLMVGGVLLANFWWGSVFLMAPIVAAVLIVVGGAILPEFRNPDAPRPDWFSSILSLCAILPAVYGVKELSRNGWEVLPVVAILVGIAFGVVFVRRQRWLSTPLLDLALFKLRNFSVPLLALFLHSAFTGTVLLFIMQHFQLVEGLTPWKAGLALVPGMVMSSLCAPFAAVLARRFRPAYLIASGEIVVILGLLLVFLSGAYGSTALLIVGFAVWSMGGTPILAVGMTLIVGSAPPEKAGSASSMPQISNEVGTAIGVGTVGSIGVAFYHAQVVDTLPAELPAEAAGAASQSIANAMGTASALPPDLAGAVVSAAQEAYTSSMQLVTGITAAVLVGVIGFVVVRLRRVRPLGQEELGTPELEKSGVEAVG